MTATQTIENLIAAFYAAEDEDQAAEIRLVLADALEEDGQDQRAEWHRFLAEETDSNRSVKLNDIFHQNGLEDGTVESGYLLAIWPEDEGAEIVSGAEYDEDGYMTSETVRYGFHGNDVPPCQCEYAGYEDDEWYVISDTKEIDLPEGWASKPFDLSDLEMGDLIFDDGVQETRFIEHTQDGTAAFWLKY